MLTSLSFAKFRSFRIAPHSSQIFADVNIQKDDKGIVFSSFDLNKIHSFKSNNCISNEYSLNAELGQHSFSILGTDISKLNMNVGLNNINSGNEILVIWNIPKHMCNGKKYFISGSDIMKNFVINDENIYDSKGEYEEICVFIGADSYKSTVSYGIEKGIAYIERSNANHIECKEKQCHYKAEESFFVRYEVNEDTKEISLKISLDDDSSVFNESINEPIPDCFIFNGSLSYGPIYPKPNPFLIIIVFIIMIFIIFVIFVIRKLLLIFCHVEIFPCCGNNQNVEQQQQPPRGEQPSTQQIVGPNQAQQGYYTTPLLESQKNNQLQPGSNYNELPAWQNEKTLENPYDNI